jgi:hypothetical protein
MNGDFTRFTFDSSKQYAQVLKQQGRVDLDSDWNEAGAIQTYLDETRATDIIGPCGAPADNAGFEVGVTPDGRDLTLSVGRIYVDGILCQTRKTSYDQQPYYLDPPPIVPENGRFDLVYLMCGGGISLPSKTLRYWKKRWAGPTQRPDCKPYGRLKYAPASRKINVTASLPHGLHCRRLINAAA